MTGGAGYIGSHMAHLLVRSGRKVVIIDDLSSGRREAIPPGVPHLEADVRDRAAVSAFLREHEVDAIFHFASRIQVGESVVDPRLHYTGNLAAAIALLESALDANVGAFILSSTAAVYGLPGSVPITEHHSTIPINPYGDTKLAIERMLESYGQAYGLKYASLRYFNAAGADAGAGLGECHEPESHLIPIVLDVALGKRDHVTIYGRDYPTPDGTCIRDYVHVSDLADAHLAALACLEGGESGVFNLGTGVGHSVQEVIETARKVTGRAIAVTYGARREGDPPELVASPTRAEVRLGWRAKRPSLEEIIRDAWAWHLRGGVFRR